MNDAVIQAKRLTRTFPDGVVAVSDLNLKIDRGSVFGLIGRNGSGKTTVMRLLLGLLKRDSGEAKILGHDFWAAPREVRSRVAYVPQGNQLHGWMSIEELSRYVGHFHEHWDAGYARKLAGQFDLPWTRKVGELSNGQQHKAALMLAFASKPEVLVLDEPGAGFDVIARKEIIDLMIDTVTASGSCTVLISSHQVADLERICSHVGILDCGRLTQSAELETLLATTKKVQVVFQESGPPRDFSIPGMITGGSEGPVFTATVNLESEHQLAAAREIPGARVNVFPLGLEEIFVELVKQPEPADAPVRDLETADFLRTGNV